MMNRQNGFGLIEILITLVVLGVAVVGLVTFSKSTLVASQDGRRYETAMRLAESKLDEFRNFSNPLDYEAFTNSPSAGEPIDGQSGDTYLRTWTIKNKYWNNATTTWEDAAPVGYPLGTLPGRKLVTVVVSWSDNGNKPQSLQLASSISPTESLLKSDMNGGLDASHPKPQINYNPGAVPDVVAIALDNGSMKETSKPLPNITGNKSNDSRLVQFDTVSYQTTGMSTKQSQQDIATTYCSCSASGQEDAYLPSTPYYSSTEKVQYWKSGTIVNKTFGVFNKNVQSDLCNTCCHDHFDGSDKNFSSYYAPISFGNNLGGVKSGSYMDACRFIRIDGIYRPAPDWYLASLVTFSSDFLTDINNLSNYQAYITDVVSANAQWQKKIYDSYKTSDGNWGAWPKTNVQNPPKISFNDWLRDSPKVTLGSRSTAKIIPSGPLQLISRGIYVDIMSPDYLDSEVFGGNLKPNLAKIPFQEINLTLLSDWTSSDTSIATVKNDPIDTISDPANKYYGTYKRGLLETGKSAADFSNKTVDITVASEQGNLGVVGILPANTSAATATIRISFQPQNKSTIHGNIYCLNLKMDVNNQVTTYSAVPCESKQDRGIDSKIIVVGGDGLACEVLADQGYPSTRTYTCSGYSGNGTMTLTNNKYVQYSSGPSGGAYQPAQIIIPLPEGQSTGPCVMMVSQDLRDNWTKLPDPKPVLDCY